MKKILISLILVSCSSVNRDYQDYYQANKTFRHGVVPVEVELKDYKVDVALDPKAISRGKIVYEKNCTECHGADGRAQTEAAKKLIPPPRDLVQLTREVPNFKLFVMVSHEQATMPGWKHHFTKDELRDLEHYIRSLGNDS